eukprot:8991379-Pyramimonas_sp.AAC.1
MATIINSCSTWTPCGIISSNPYNTWKKIANATDSEFLNKRRGASPPPTAPPRTLSRAATACRRHSEPRRGATTRRS